MLKLKRIAIGLLCLGVALSASALLKANEPKATEVAQSLPIQESVELNTTIQDVETLFILMQERLAIMHDLARYKWNQGLNDKTLNQELLTANKKHESPEVLDFLKAQNEAALELQKQDFLLFKNEGIEKFESVKDYKTEILPELESLNQKLIVTFEDLLTHNQNESLPEFLKDITFNSFKNEGVERNVYDIAVEPLFKG